MPVWQVVLLLNLTLAVGLGFGYGVWGHRLAALDGELRIMKAQSEKLERERQACIAGARVGQQQWEGRGIVRAVYPQLALITHEEVAGLLSARTTGFKVAPSVNLDQVRTGDAVRFWLHGNGTDVLILVRIEPW
jgi:Cu/Ag efflux protein CusF